MDPDPNAVIGYIKGTLVEVLGIRFVESGRYRVVAELAARTDAVTATLESKTTSWRPDGTVRRSLSTSIVGGQRWYGKRELLKKGAACYR